MGCNPTGPKRFKLSKDPHFTEKLTDVVGLYLNPPDKAVVLCVDEKSQIQPLQRTQPGPAHEKGTLWDDDPTTISGTGPPPCFRPLISWMDA